MDDQEKGTQTSTTNEKYNNKISTKSGLLIFIFTNKKNYKHRNTMNNIFFEKKNQQC